MPDPSCLGHRPPPTPAATQARETALATEAREARALAQSLAERADLAGRQLSAANAERGRVEMKLHDAQREAGEACRARAEAVEQARRGLEEERRQHAAAIGEARHAHEAERERQRREHETELARARRLHAEETTSLRDQRNELAQQKEALVHQLHLLRRSLQQNRPPPPNHPPPNLPLYRATTPPPPLPMPPPQLPMHAPPQLGMRQPPPPPMPPPPAAAADPVLALLSQHPLAEPGAPRPNPVPLTRRANTNSLCAMGGRRSPRKAAARPPAHARRPASHGAAHKPCEGLSFGQPPVPIYRSRG